MSQLKLAIAKTEADRQKCFDIRRVVFIDEQNCPPELEWDEFEDSAVHFLALSGDDIIGTARMREIERDGEPTAKLERFAILREFRGRGFGKLLVQATIDDASGRGYSRFFLNAQEHLEGMYGSLGFKRAGDIFMEAGIPHLPMEMRTDTAGD